MPKLSDTMEEGLIIKWYKQEGESVESGDALAEIETDKAVMDLEAYASGVMRKILVPGGTKVPAGALIAVIARQEEDISDILKETPSATGSPIPAPSSEKPASSPPPSTAAGIDAKPSITPRARQMATDSGIDLSFLRGSGPDGLITEKDVKSEMKNHAQPGSDSETVDLSPMRNIIGRRMVQSKQTIPHFYVTTEIAMDRSLETKRRLEREGTNVSITDIIVHAVGSTLREFSFINAAYAAGKLRKNKSIHIGLAVGLEDGIMTPVIRNADKKTVEQIASVSKILIERAKTRKIAPEEYTGSTFSLSNIGMFDVDHFMAIIQPGEGAALAVGSVKEVPVIEQGKVVSGHRMKVTLSCDHRVIDGLQAARFLQGLKRRLEDGNRKAG